MYPSRPIVFITFLATLSLNAIAATHYVNLNNLAPTPPYASWPTAATNIQDAIDSSVDGDLVLVTNGIYATGGRVVTAPLTNRVVLTKPITLQSVNGPAFTEIRGYQVPGTITGNDAVRCIYLTNSATVAGFTISTGGTDYGGYGGGICGNGGFIPNPNNLPVLGTVSNCVLIGNVASFNGGGVFGASVLNSQIISNTVNTAEFGGGGGAYQATLNNCLIAYNTALSRAGGVFACTLTNCTVVQNTNGGAASCNVLSSIIYNNDPWNYSYGEYSGFEVRYSCIFPLPSIGSQNFTNDPLFVSSATGDFHLQTDSPCIDISPEFNGTVDLDGNPRVTGIRVDLGAYELAAQRTPLIRYVNLNNANPSWPYATWITAATNIQDAVDVAVPGDVVLVTNGVYETGGRLSGMSNRIVIAKPLKVISANGPASTVIKGYQVPGVTNGNQSIRCVLLTDSATLSGFTLTEGSTSPGNAGGGVFSDNTGIVTNCILLGNTSDGGGGAAAAALYDCQLINNRADSGGGVAGGTLDRCVLKGNYASGNGGAVYGIAVLNNCLVISNSTAGDGGAGFGDDDYYERLLFKNCTVVGNSSSGGFEVGGALYGTMQNSIIYGNMGVYENGSILDGCCCPEPSGPGNITNAPLFVDAANGDFRLQNNSPCINAGKNDHVTTSADLDGHPRIQGIHVDIGAFEFPIALALEADNTNVATGFPVNFTWQVFAGNVFQLILNYGDGLILTNALSTSHAWYAPGSYTVGLTVFSDLYPAGISASVLVQVAAETLYVSQASPNPIAPYGSWFTAATNIQDAIDAAFAGCRLIVSNGVYQTGTRILYDYMTNRVAITKPLRMQSVNGADVTVLDGGNEVRCLYLSNRVSVTGFTLRNGNQGAGAGVFCQTADCVLSNCIVSGNTAATDGNSSGGGAWGGTLNRCLLHGNETFYGGGAAFAILNECTIANNLSYAYGGGTAWSDMSRCTIISNSAAYGGGCFVAASINNCVIAKNMATGASGGTRGGSLTNCTVVGNSAPYAGGVDYADSVKNCIVYYNTGTGGNIENVGNLDNCCLTPNIGGVGNITNAPLFISLATGNYRLQNDSPCVNAGSNAFVGTATDADGRPRIYNGTVDMGAYEFQSTNLNTFIGWLQQNGLPADGSSDFIDTDGDGANNWQEWRADTSPTNAASALRIGMATNGATGLLIRWASVATRRYWLERGADLSIASPFQTIATNLPGVAGIQTYNDFNATNGGPYFYRVGVQ